MPKKERAKYATKVQGDSDVTFNFEDGTTLVCKIDDLPAAMQLKTAVYGVSQKVGDKYAKCESIEEAIALANEVWEDLKNGVFNKRTTGTGGKVVAALARMASLSIADAYALWKEKSEEEQAIIKGHADTKLVIKQMDLEKAQADLEAAKTDDEEGVDLSSLWS